MSDDFEDLLKRWLRDRAGNDRSALQALAGNVATLPPRRREPGRLLPLVASLALVVGLLAVVSPRFGSIGNDASPTPSPTIPQIAESPSAPAPSQPLAGKSPAIPDPSEFVGNPWFEHCGGLAVAFTAFDVPRARDIWLFLPAMLGAPELERDEPAFVLVYQGSFPGPVLVRPPESGTTLAPKPTLAPNHHDMCVIVGPVSGAGTFTIYGDVSFEGFDPHPNGAASPPPPTTDAPPFPVWPGIAWSDESGRPADPLVLAAFAGPESCGWDSAAFLEIGWPFGSQALTIDTVRRYVRDPDGLFNDGYIIRDELDLSAEVPADATFAGYRSGDIELWTSPSTIDRAVFLRWPDHVEQWPRMENVASCG